MYRYPTEDPCRNFNEAHQPCAFHFSLMQIWLAKKKKKNPLKDLGKARVSPASEAYRIAEVRFVSIVFK